MDVQMGDPRMIANTRYQKAIRMVAYAERPGSGTPGQSCSIIHREAIPALPGAGWLGDGVMAART